MTEREFLNAVLATEGISDDVRTHATEGVAKLDSRNDKRKNTQTKVQKENEAVMERICDLLAEGDNVASAIGAALGISTQKASSLCGLLVKAERVTVTDIKVKGKGAVKQYSLVVTGEATDEDEVEGEDTPTDNAEG